MPPQRWLLLASWGEHRLAAGILVAFDFFLRTGELFLLRRSHVEHFPRSASLQLLQTKSSSLRIHAERLMSCDYAAFVAIKTFGCQPTLARSFDWHLRSKIPYAMASCH